MHKTSKTKAKAHYNNPRLHLKEVKIKKKFSFVKIFNS